MFINFEFGYDTDGEIQLGYGMIWLELFHNLLQNKEYKSNFEKLLNQAGVEPEIFVKIGKLDTNVTFYKSKKKFNTNIIFIQY